MGDSWAGAGVAHEARRMRGMAVRRRMTINKHWFRGSRLPLGLGGLLAFYFYGYQADFHRVDIPPKGWGPVSHFLVLPRLPRSIGLTTQLALLASPSLLLRPHAPLLLRLRHHPLGKVDPLLRLAQLPPQVAHFDLE